MYLVAFPRWGHTAPPVVASQEFLSGSSITPQVDSLGQYFTLGSGEIRVFFVVYFLKSSRK